MAISSENRATLIGLSVTMLDSAPGTDLLNEWVTAHEGGRSLEEIANDIASSSAFQANYPPLMTSGEFAVAFMNSVLGGEVSNVFMSTAVTIVTDLLDSGMTRGGLAVAVVQALSDIYGQGAAHSAWADLGMAATALHNKTEVATYHTVILLQSSPSSRVLRDVDSTVGLDELRGSINDLLDAPDPVYLTSGRDVITGTAAKDLFVSEPLQGASTLESIDVIDGGGGNDTLEVYGSASISIGPGDAQVKDVENVYLNTPNGIDVDLTAWQGVESVELGRFGGNRDVSVTVKGAAVSSGHAFGGANVTIVGVAGDLALTAGENTAVTVGSGGHTATVQVTGGKSVRIDADGAGGQSQSVTSVSVDGVQRDLGSDNQYWTDYELIPYESALHTKIDTGHANHEAKGTWVSPPDNSGFRYRTDDPILALNPIPGTEDGPSLQVYSDAIQSIGLSGNDAIVEVMNESAGPEDLAITVDRFGEHKQGASHGVLSLGGSGAAENVNIVVAGDSKFRLDSDSIRTLDVSGNADLQLSVRDVANIMRPSTLESVTLRGGGGFAMDAGGLTGLRTIDAGASSGANVIESIGGSVSSVTGGSGSDTIHVLAHSSAGINVNLGAGNDTFHSGAGDPDSRVDGGAGRDTLKLVRYSNNTYTDSSGQLKSIYSGFEVLDVGGDTVFNNYDVALLGVDEVRVGSNALSGVGLNNMADGMGIAVNGMGTLGTSAYIVHDMPSRGPGDARYSGVLDVSLVANGGVNDTRIATTGKATLQLRVDAEIEVLNVDSSANAGGSLSAPNDRPAAGDYENTLALVGDGVSANATVAAINVGGAAKVHISETLFGFGALSKVDATGNSGGVTVERLDSAPAVEMLGGSGGDDFYGSTYADVLHGNGGSDTLVGAAGDDKIRGGAGGDFLEGGRGSDTFEYTSVSDSQVAWTAQGEMYGFDVIRDWDANGDTDVISLGSTLFNSLSGTLKDEAGPEIDETDPLLPDTLRDFLGNGDGVFETETQNVGGLGSTVTRHPIAILDEMVIDQQNQLTPMTWILIDVDGDGDFDATVDMAIRLEGDIAITDADFSA